MKIKLKNRELTFSFSYDGTNWQGIGLAFDPSVHSDDYTQGGGFTGAFVGLTCIDYQNRKKI